MARFQCRISFLFYQTPLRSWSTRSGRSFLIGCHAKNALMAEVSPDAIKYIPVETVQRVQCCQSREERLLRTFSLNLAASVPGADISWWRRQPIRSVPSRKYEEARPINRKRFRTHTRAARVGSHQWANEAKRKHKRKRRMREAMVSRKRHSRRSAMGPLLFFFGTQVKRRN